MTIDVLHRPGGPDRHWSRVNQAEARVGVQTPLSVTVWEAISERGYRHAYVGLGLLPPSALEVPPAADERFGSVFHGRGAVNLDVLRSALAAAPGGIAEAAERGYFSSLGTAPPRPPWPRRAGAAVRVPVAVARTRRHLGAVRAASRARWERSLAELPTADLPAATGALRRAVDAAMGEMTCQITIGTAASQVHGAIQEVVAAAGRPDLSLALIGGFGRTEDVEVAARLWDVSRGRGTLDDVVAAYGFHGPAESELSSRSWREDRRALEAVVAGYGRKPDGDDPRSLERRRAREREEAERALLGSLSGPDRLRARWALHRGRAVLPLREVAKAAFTQTFDVCRAAARAIGAHLAEAGAIDDPEDVFHLALGEVLAGDRGDLRPVVAFRRRRRAEHQAVDIPMAWTGVPRAVPAAPPLDGGAGAPGGEVAAPGTVVSGLGVSPGVVEGVAHLVADPSDPGDVPPGGVLVCHTTDPSWASLFVLADAVVIDVGGVLSHGAIVARELGIPCVINAATATRELRSGDRVRVDGTAGSVTVLDRPGATP